MKLGDLTYVQMMILCRATDCEECDFHLTGEWEWWKCLVLIPREWEEYLYDRYDRFSMPYLERVGDQPMKLNDLDIPKVWERHLEAEHQLMLSLLEVKPCD